MRAGNNIILIGFMGSGKTSVGVRLSYRLRMTVEDTDKLIEKRTGKSVGDIFAEDGEAAFRQMETELLEEIRRRPYAQILSVGGGTPVKAQNRRLLRECGMVVYLKIKPESAYERLKGDTSRPLLQCENPLERIRTLMKEREQAYEQCADVTIQADALEMEDILQQIEKAVKQKKEGRTKLLVINGPNLNFLGIREKSVYGTQDYNYLLGLIEEKGRQLNADIEVFQSNHEGAMIDRLQESYFDGTEGIVINPGAYTHYSYAIRDALASITVPKAEVHISDITKREEFRKISVTAPACDKQIYGQGLAGYLQAIDFVTEQLKAGDSR